MRFEWGNDKNEFLKKQRNVCFEDVVKVLSSDGDINIVPHFNKNYPHQEIIVLKLNNYIHYVPFIEEDGVFFLKTIIPSRRLNKIYNTGII